MIEFRIEKKLLGPEGKMGLDVNTMIQEGEFVTLYGPSGAGKTSLFRILAGLLLPESGCIRVGDKVWFDSELKINLKPQERNIGMVFQDYSLFPNMSVRQNLEFALEKGQSRTIIEELLELIELNNLTTQRPAQLSGGQKQRVALARALVRRPKILLLDEPLSALDPEMQSKLQDYILKVHQEYGLTTLMISHDLIEVIKMSERVLLLKQGKVVNDGKPSEVLPLEGLRNFLEGKLS
ncbi:ATP-binding cassette domain-containing protein [uncultured Algoriphagus sp.]|uniref:ATP-binding cassette domain-containing protein n=1 Tax=uncultured Algoriphagus sp. TaxID=417365 RepID=UPI0030EC9A7C|tara:strand:- start:26329 stop:27039 length:711 start_codon:yes stop_codon:yes gene_type:complete